MTVMSSPLRIPLADPDEALPAAALDAADFSMTMSVSPPPGLVLTRAASLPLDMRAEVRDATPSPATSLSPVKPDLQGNGMRFDAIELNGAACTSVEWWIDDLRGRLQGCMVRPLVSPPFSACGLPNLRLMVFPDARESLKSARSRERKGLYERMVRRGPLYCALKLKADCLRQPTVIAFYVTVGAVRRGPFEYDFSEQAIHGCDDCGVDWLKQVDERTGGLRVSVEILEVRVKGDLAAKAVGLGQEPLSLYSMLAA